MKTVRFSGTDIDCSEIGLGTGKFGTGTPREAAFRVLDAFVDAGGNLIDSAHVYGGANPGVKSPAEETVGAWIEARGARNRVVLCTKGGHPEFDFATRVMGPPRVTPEALAEDLEMSRESLRAETIDFYLPHRDDPSVPVPEILGWLEDQVKDGRVRYYGCSNWTVARMREAAAWAAETGAKGFVCSQIEGPLAKIGEGHLSSMNMTGLDAEMLAWHEESGLGLMTAVTLAGGYFHRRLAGRELSPLQEKMYGNPENEALFVKIRELAAQGYPAAGLLHRANRAHPFPTVSLMGFSSAEQFAEVLRDIAVPVPDGVIRDLWAIRFPEG